MADSPGKLLSSFASTNQNKGDNSKVGGCADVFFQFLGRFNSRKILPHKLLPSEKSKHNTISHTEEKLPMAKLLLIADEERIAASKREKENLSDEAFQGDENHEGQRGMPVSVVAKLMGLETMPSFKLPTETQNTEVPREEAEAQSARKPLHSKKLSVKRAQRNTKAMDIRMQTLKRVTKFSHTDHLCGVKVTGSISVTYGLKHTSVSSRSNVKSSSCATTAQMNSRKGERSRTSIFSKLPLPTFETESQLRSIVTPSRISNKLLSPVKSPLSSRSAACLFEAAARILEPNFRPARYLSFSPPSVHSAPRSNADEGNRKQDSTLTASKSLVQSKVMLTECKGQAISKHLNSSSKQIRQPSLDHPKRDIHFTAKEGARKTLPQIKYEKRSNKISSVKKQSLVSDSCKSEANEAVTGGCRLRTSRTSNVTSARSSQIDNKQEIMLVTDGDSNKKGSISVQGPRMSLTSPGAGPAKATHREITFQLSRIESSQQLNNPLIKLAKNMIQEGGRNNLKTRTAYDSKSTSSGKTNSTGAHGRSNKVQSKGESSCSGASSKRKASSFSTKPTDLSTIARADEGDFRLQISESERRQRLALERPSMLCHNEFNVPAACYDKCNMTSSIEADLRGPTRVRARWDVTDERKKSLIISHITCNPTSNSVCKDLSGDAVLDTDKATTDLWQESPLSLDALTYQSLCAPLGKNKNNTLLCNDGSEASNYCSSRDIEESTGLLNGCSSNIDSYLGGAKQQSRSYRCTPKREDGSAPDSESMSGPFCAEEFEQPSPVSILESPFHDYSSSSSDSFEAPQGLKLCEAMANEDSEYLSTVENYMENVRSHGILTHSSFVHCLDSQSSDFGAKSQAMTEHEERYLKNVLCSVESAEWERLALSGPLINPLIYHQLEESPLHTHTARMSTAGLCKELDHEKDQCYTAMHITFTAAQQQRRLFFDCIEVALKLSLELAMQSYGLILPCLQLPPAYLLKAVYKHLDQWKGLAFSMNLDDMMVMEINWGMGQWFKHDDGVDIIATSVEALIFNSLIDELTKDVRKDV
ncbi:hypothetical protein L7F22_010253 [Adiantum nelumboides]|nr:hypothetical protein [Adiantum nelumboides]